MCCSSIIHTIYSSLTFTYTYEDTKHVKSKYTEIALTYTHSYETLSPPILLKMEYHDLTQHSPCLIASCVTDQRELCDRSPSTYSRCPSAYDNTQHRLQGSNSLTTKNSRTFRDHKNIFQDFGIT